MNIINHPNDSPWSWEGLSRNPSITFDIVKKHPDGPLGPNGPPWDF